jgi:hypothetical protein
MAQNQITIVLNGPDPIDNCITIISQPPEPIHNCITMALNLITIVLQLYHNHQNPFTIVLQWP